MRILMLGPPRQTRGPIPKLLDLLAPALRALGCEVELAAWGGRRADETLREKLFSRVADLRAVRRLLRASPFDVVVVHTAHDWRTLTRDLALLLATRGGRHRTVLQFHGSRPERLLGPGARLFKLASAALLRASDACLVLSSAEQRQWQSFRPAARIYLVRNPIAAVAPPPAGPRGRLGVPDGVPLVLFAGRLIETKGVFDLIAALPLVRAATPCHLLIAGEGACAGEVRAWAARADMSTHVTLAGYLEGEMLQAAYHAADVFVLPSWREGSPVVIGEAMCAGLPLVTTRIAGTVDHLAEGVNALLVPPRDPAALAAALVRLLADEPLRDRMGMANRAKAQQFAPELVARQYLDVLREIGRTP